MKNIFIYAFLIICTATFTSCEEDGYEDFTKVQSPVLDASADWFVEGFAGDTQITGYFKITTSNTNANIATEIQVNDLGNFWEFKVNSPIDMNALTFGGTDLQSDVDGYEVSVTITNGAILKNAHTTDIGSITDSISFDVEFSDNPGTIYTLKGYKRTGFLDDEH